MGRGATCWPSSSLTSGWVTPLAFFLPKLMGRWGGRGGLSLTADRIVNSPERLQNVTSGGLWFDLVTVVVRVSNTEVSTSWGEHSGGRQNDNRELSLVSPVRGLLGSSQRHKNKQEVYVHSQTGYSRLSVVICFLKRDIYEKLESNRIVIAVTTEQLKNDRHT